MALQQLCELRLFAGSRQTCHRIAVSYFSEELASLIDRQFEGSQLKFGRAVGVDQSMVSRQCAGLSMPDRATVHRLAKALSETQAIPLVVAYLQDHCPLQLRSKVVIQARPQLGKSRSGDSLKIDLARFTTRQRSLIREFMDIVVADPGATSFLEALLKFRDQDESSKHNST
jgi:transcriptional regulator with XRE-family HTH domain